MSAAVEAYEDKKIDRKEAVAHPSFIAAAAANVVAAAAAAA